MREIIWNVVRIGVLIGGVLGWIYLTKDFFDRYRKEALKLIKQEMSDERETLIEFVLKMQDEYYDDRKAVCMKDCSGRQTGSEFIDHKLALIGKPYYEKEEEVKECPDFADFPLPEGRPDPLPLCQSCHSASICPERDDTKETCEAYMEDEDDIPGMEKQPNPSNNISSLSSLIDSLPEGADVIAPQNAAEVEAVNIEAAESVKDIIPIEEMADMVRRVPNPRRESTKAALKESIGIKKD